MTANNWMIQEYKDDGSSTAEIITALQISNKMTVSDYKKSLGEIRTYIVFHLTDIGWIQASQEEISKITKELEC